MIILQHVRVERFRLLRDVDLHFPPRGSILIVGPNESGKSALFESIYFALYGQSLTSNLVGEDVAVGREAGLDDLVPYGETEASVTLSLSIGVTEVTITRRIERGKGQRATLSIRRLGMPEEQPITDLDEVNARILAELGGLDGEALRNSCLIEQKGGNRLEYLDGSQREATVGKLLGLEQLVHLSEQFELTEHDEQLLAECRLRLKLADVQARIPEISKHLGELEAALDAVTITEYLAERDSQKAEIAEQESSLQRLALQRDEIKSRQNRIAHLKKADAILGEIIGAYDAIAEAQRELPDLERQIVELERREHDELPALENRVHDLSDLTRSFSTLERLAADLLATVNTIKVLEQQLQEQEDLQKDLLDLEEQIIAARLRVEQARQSQHEVEERDRAARPQLESRLQRLQALANRARALAEAEERFVQRRAQQGLAEENSAELKKVQRALHEAETELALVEHEAEQREQQADALEGEWRNASIGRQLKEWRRVKGLSQEVVEAEQHVMVAHSQQEQLTQQALAARRAVTKNMGIAIACITLFLLCLSAALLLALHASFLYATIAGLAAFVVGVVAGVSLQNYRKSREEERVADAQMQDAINRVGMMVAAREEALRLASGIGENARSYDEALAHVEHELRSLGGTIPHSLEEAERSFAALRMTDPAESLADIQQRMTESRDKALAARHQVDVTMEAVADLRKEYSRLEKQRKQEGWDTLSEQLLSDATAIEQLRHEIISSAGEEGLPIPKFDSSPTTDNVPVETEARPSASPSVIDRPSTQALTQFTIQLEDAIRSTGREIATLDGKLDLLPELKAQVDVHQAALDVLVTRKQALEARRISTHSTNSIEASNTLSEQIEHARQQQVTLRNGLRSLQDLLRERVQKLGVSFGQAAISTAEVAARKQLESLHILLGQRVELENRHATYAMLLQDRQEALSEHYAQLAKLSSTLGSWIVPLSPFTEDLAALRARCRQEVYEANEEEIQQQLEALNIQEAASRAKIALCHEEIEAAHERIATLLAQRNRPPAKGYSLGDIVAVWPLVGEHSPQDRERLQQEMAAIEQELHELEEQERRLSNELSVGTARIDLSQARKRVEQQERLYETKKRGSLLVQAVQDRLMQKMLPRTEYYLQQLLPTLTWGRFHDARLTGQEVPQGRAQGTVPTAHSEGAWQVSVWEPQAFSYIPRSALSSGTADAVSLALRLAFAIAALPSELNMAPGFLLLDEPLGASDSERAQALLELVTGPLLSSHFEQILLVSHRSAWNPARFVYHVTIDNGEVVESSLPTIPHQETSREAVFVGSMQSN